MGTRNDLIQWPFGSASHGGFVSNLHTVYITFRAHPVLDFMLDFMEISLRFVMNKALTAYQGIRAIIFAIKLNLFFGGGMN